MIDRFFHIQKGVVLCQDFLLGGAAGGRLVFSFESSGQGGPIKWDLLISIPIKVSIYIRLSEQLADT